MESRLASLLRLTQLYGSLEKLRQQELGLALAEMKDIEAAIHLKRIAVHSLRLDAKAALAAGDWMEWNISDKVSTVATANMQRLEPLHAMRKLAVHTAQASYRASRMQYEQVSNVCKAANLILQAKEERRLQAASDDLFLSRQRWIESSTSLRQSNE